MPTIRETEMKRAENLALKKKEMQQWGMYKYPTPTKRIKSVSMLRRKIEEFFDENPVDRVKADKLPTPTQLAVYLGYPSARAMYDEINNPKEPDYSAILARGVDIIKDALGKRQLKIAEEKADWKGIDAYLTRLDAEADKTDPNIKKGAGSSKTEVNVTVNMERQERIKDYVSDKMDSLMAEFEEVKEDDEKNTVTTLLEDK